MPKGLCGFQKGHPKFKNSGRKKGCIPWIKGKKHSKESIEKMRLSHIGKIPWNKGKKGLQIAWNKDKKMPQISGKNHPMWKGGIVYNHGYVYIHSPEHPFCECKGYVKRSRLVMEKKLGHYLKPSEQVHHKGIHFPLGSLENKQDDSPENLGLFGNNSKHLKFHYSKRKRNKLGQFV